MNQLKTESLCEKCPNTGFFLVRIFSYSDQKKLLILTLFTQRIKQLMVIAILHTEMLHLHCKLAFSYIVNAHGEKF